MGKNKSSCCENVRKSISELPVLEIPTYSPENVIANLVIYEVLLHTGMMMIPGLRGIGLGVTLGAGYLMGNACLYHVKETRKISAEVARERHQSSPLPESSFMEADNSSLAGETDFVKEE